MKDEDSGIHGAKVRKKMAFILLHQKALVWL